ncbi:ankyrin repeat domain-containing protein [Aspergillus undulatus]|uniref:ankyrin repeat domain-containing protein n=1 Tax=Aspergillus undulatus TaxID=1810928 RepID=UPI003CCCEE8D
MLMEVLVLDTACKTEAMVGKIRSRLNSEEDLDILDWLTHVDYGPQHSDYLERRQPGTGRWLLNSAQYQAWVTSDKQTLFCPGIPGAGKTILSATIIDDITARFQHDASVGIAYVYIDYRRQAEQSINHLVASIIKSLNSVATTYSRAFLIVDALDESCRANFLATSRFIPQITERFKDSMILEVRADDQDVRTYLRGRISQTASSLLNSHSDDIQNKITQAVDGMFLLAQLHFDTIKIKRTTKKIKETLKVLPKGSEAYNHAYSDAMLRIEAHDADSQKIAKDVLAWINRAKRPLNTLELRHALAVEAGSDFDLENLLNLDDIVSVCARLVTVDEHSRIIRLVHYTAQEYFQRTWTKWFPDADHDIAVTCLTYLLFDSFKEGPCPTDTDFEARLDAYPLYSYASSNWGYHACVQKIPQDLAMAFFGNKSELGASVQGIFASILPLDANADPESRDAEGRTLLAWSACNGHESIVTTLLYLEQCIDIDSRDNYGRTPLSLATSGGYAEIAKALLQKGADPDSKD